MHFKGLIFVLDGLGDRPSPVLDGQTPLEAAHTPNLDRLAAHGQTGLMDPLVPGLPVDTHTGVAMIFGLSPKDAVVLSRGPIEAAGIDLELQHGDILLRSNLATVERHNNGFSIIDRRAGRIQEGVEVLCQSLREVSLGGNVVASLHPATQHRTVLRLRGFGLSEAITDTDPGSKSIDRGVLQSHARISNDTAAQLTAQAINQFVIESHNILDKHPVNRDRRKRGLPPANAVISRGAGSYRPAKNLLNQLELKVSTVAGESTILGLAKLFGFSAISSDRFTSLPDTDIEGKVQAANESLSNHDLAFVHLKGTDTAAHDLNPELKRDFIERFDRSLGTIDTDNLVVGVCADHSTDSIRGDHNGDAVPVLLYNPEGRRDTAQAYSETACTVGALTRVTAQGFLMNALDAMGSMSNYSSMDLDFLD
ncbi:MAG: 2,3-bisphosphoglycerate-independent phosphoglycerate mutase [Pseudomonadota bacterium]